MKECVATIAKLDRLSTRSSVQDITGQPSRLMLKHMSRSVINVSDSVTSQTAVGVPYPNDGPMALCTVGVRYFGSLSQTNEIFGGRN